MKIWSNTTTLAGHLGDIAVNAAPEAAEIALVGGKPISLETMPNLRGIFKCGVGLDNLPLELAKARGIVVELPSKESCRIIFDETANFTCHLLLRGLYAQCGEFSEWTKHERTALRDRHLLVVGAGRIGSRVADRMRAFMSVATFDATTHGADALHPMLAQADAVSLHLPLTETTRGMFDAAALAAMKAGTLLVNTARAAIVDEDALFGELSCGRLRAAFDVFWQEPYRGRLTELPVDRFGRTPHVASNCSAFTRALARDFAAFVGQMDRTPARAL